MCSILKVSHVGFCFVVLCVGVGGVSFCGGFFVVFF